MNIFNLTKDLDFISYQDYKALINELHNLKKGSKIYIDKHVKFPRRKFNAEYPDYNISRLKNAEFVIFDLSIFARHFYKRNDIPDFQLVNYKSTDTVYYGYGFPKNTYYWYTKINNINSLIEEYLKIGKKIIWLDDFKQLTKKPVISEEQYQNLKTLISSGNLENVKLALTMMTSFNVDINIVTLLIESNFRGVYSPSVEIRTLISNIKSLIGRSISTSFSDAEVMKLYINNIDNQRIKKLWQERIGFKVKIVKDEETTDTI